MKAIFPFPLNEFDGNRLFGAYVKSHRGHLDETYGHCFLSTKKTWYYYQVDVVVVSECRVTFTTYDMDCPAEGGRGCVQEVIAVETDPGNLAALIEEHKRRMAAAEQKRRAGVRRALEAEAEANEIYKELK